MARYGGFAALVALLFLAPGCDDDGLDGPVKIEGDWEVRSTGTSGTCGGPGVVIGFDHNARVELFEDSGLLYYRYNPILGRCEGTTFYNFDTDTAVWSRTLFRPRPDCELRLDIVTTLTFTAGSFIGTEAIDFSESSGNCDDDPVLGCRFVVEFRGVSCTDCVGSCAPGAPPSQSLGIELHGTTF